MKERAHTVITTLLALVALGPLLAVNSESWDTTLVQFGFMTGDWSSIRPWLLDLGWYEPYYLYRLFAVINSLTGIPPKVFTNLLCVLSILGIAREVFLLLRSHHAVSREAAFVGAWVVLCFPIWHIFISSAVFINIVCLWLFLLAVRAWRFNKALAFLLFVLSLQLYSIFAFVIGFAVAEFLFTARRDNFMRTAVKTFLFCLGVLLLYFLFNLLVNLHGKDGTYNTINLQQLDSLLQYVATAAALMAAALFLKKKLPPDQAEHFTRSVAAALALMLFAGLAYWAVGRPLRFFSFGSYSSRHAMLMCVPFALLAAIAHDYAARFIGRKRLAAFTACVLTALVVLLYQGYDHKIAAVIYKEMLTREFAKTQAPPSGYVEITADGHTPPKHIHQYEVNMSLFQAYGKAAWMCNGFWESTRMLGLPALQKHYDMPQASRRLYIASDVTGDAYSRYSFTVKGFHQEGRIWYWLYYALGSYGAFEPRLSRIDS
ncbi:hypothetical protein M7784_12350 [Desulfovibrio aminophilus]|nr:hypothetical protein [Desulfovibrio aminophilus]MCM0756030.1 hypothetical protein [Desulfovibrio aminophilus]